MLYFNRRKGKEIMKMKYEVRMKAKGAEAVLYKKCPNKGYAYTVATSENSKQYAKGIYISDPRFVNYYVAVSK